MAIVAELVIELCRFQVRRYLVLRAEMLWSGSPLHAGKRAAIMPSFSFILSDQVYAGASKRGFEIS
jgi:hypothetical protein